MGIQEEEDRVVKNGKVLYGGGWQPEPLTPREKSWTNPKDHAKISNYHVIRNDENALSFQIAMRVRAKDYKMAFTATKAEEVSVKIEGGCIVIVKEGETVGAYLKLPKVCDPSAKPIVEGPGDGPLFVTVLKKGAKAAPEPLNDIQLGVKPMPGFYPASEILKEDLSHLDIMRTT